MALLLIDAGWTGPHGDVARGEKRAENGQFKRNMKNYFIILMCSRERNQEKKHTRKFSLMTTSGSCIVLTQVSLSCVFHHLKLKSFLKLLFFKKIFYLIGRVTKREIQIGKIIHLLVYKWARLSQVKPGAPFWSPT